MYKYANGTSMATPHVTGATALLMSAFPDATPAQIKSALLDGANRDKNPLVYPYTYTVRNYVARETKVIDELILQGALPAASRDVMIERVTLEYEEIFAHYKQFDGAGRVSRTGLLDIKAAYDLLADRVKPISSSSSGGCNAGYTFMILLAVILGLAMIPEKH